MTLHVVGVSAGYHDAACCVLGPEGLVAAAEEERFTRIKHDASMPVHAFKWCLHESGLSITDVDVVAYYEDPVVKLHRQLWMAYDGRSGPDPASLFGLDASQPEREIRELLGFDGPVDLHDHHLSHAASAYFWSGFPSAALLTVDGVGEWATMSTGVGSGAEIRRLDEVRYPHSLGLFYSAVTSFLGFDVNDGEFKVMGLAAYGTPTMVDTFRHLVWPTPDGGFELALDQFDFSARGPLYRPSFIDLLGVAPRVPESPIEDVYADVAASAQAVLEEVLLAVVADLARRVDSPYLALAGGVGLNCAANGRIAREGPFERIFVQPAAGDAGGALGAAALSWVNRTGRRPPVDAMTRADLGPATSAAAARRAVGDLPVTDYAGRGDDLLTEVTRRLEAGQIVGWHHGRMEFGPRALGHRSILADPRDASACERVNALVKMRESFRPFAPAVLDDRRTEWFALDHPSRFMTETCVVQRDGIPAVTHVDGTARVQTVDRTSDTGLASLLETFERATGCPVLLNTSFNLRGEPIGCTPEDSLLTFLRSGLDCLVIQDLLVDRSTVPKAWIEWATSTDPRQRPAISSSVYTFF